MIGLHAVGLFKIGVCEWLYLGFMYIYIYIYLGLMYMDWDVDYNWDLHILD